MKKIILLLFTSVIVYSQSFDATMTIYKNGLALIQQPVAWSINDGSSRIEFGTLPEGIRAVSYTHLTLPTSDLV